MKMNLNLKVEMAKEGEPALETQMQHLVTTNNFQAMIRAGVSWTKTWTPNPTATEVVKPSSKWEVQTGTKVESKDMSNNKITNHLSKVMSWIAKGWEMWVRGDKLDKCSQIASLMHQAPAFTKGDPWSRNTTSKRMSLFRWTNNLLSPKPTEINSNFLPIVNLAAWMTLLSSKVQEIPLTGNPATHSIKMTT